MEHVAIVGAAGKMGSWFTRYFAKRARDVCVYDVQKLITGNKVRVADSLQDCVKGAELVLVCVPVQSTAGMIKKCTKSMKAGAVIAEISSVKSKTFPALRKTRQDLQPLCIHPMFGPGASEDKMKMLLVPVRDEQAETRMVQEIFSGTDLKVMPDARSHDKTRAVVLGLTYFVNIAFGQVLSGQDISVLKRVGGTTFAVQSMLTESIMTDEPELMAALLKDNPYVSKYVRLFIKDASEISGLKGKKLDKRLRQVKSNLQRQQDLLESYRQMYRIIEQLKR
jgi:prephenate dehydrogenase